MTASEKIFEYKGGRVVYEILGESGDFIVLTPGGRFSKDIPGLRPLAQALVDGGYRVVLNRALARASSPAAQAVPGTPC
jgi:2-hydroxy-6-oxonona-2,4-dienedioate hydrolase